MKTRFMRPFLTLAVFACGIMWIAAPRRAEGADPLRRRAVAEIGLQFGPQTTVITEPLTDEGYPDYVEFLNRRRRAGVKPEENFWAAMWGATGNVGGPGGMYISRGGHCGGGGGTTHHRRPPSAVAQSGTRISPINVRGTY